MITHQQYNPRLLSSAQKETILEQAALTRGAVVIKTCQRLEVFEGNGEVAYPIVLHLFRLASGLESNLLGDGFVLGQIKEAYNTAARTTKLHKNMHRLFQKALHVGKVTRTKTNITRGAVSYPQAALKVLTDSMELVKNKRIVVIGVNSITRSFIRLLIKQGFNDILLLNRSLTKASRLAKEYDIEYGSLSGLSLFLPDTQALLSCTSSNDHIVTMNDLGTKESLMLVDLAVPPDIHPDIARFTNNRVFTIEDVEKHIQSSLLKRKIQIKYVEKIVSQHLHEFMEWQYSNSEQHRLFGT